MSAITGSCACGKVRYTLRGRPTLADYCHCSRCRKFSGSQADPGMGARLDELEIEGREELTVYQAEGLADRAFCRSCGSSLFAGSGAFKLAGGADDAAVAARLTLVVLRFAFSQGSSGRGSDASG